MKVQVKAVPAEGFPAFFRGGLRLTPTPEEFEVTQEQLAALLSDKRVSVLSIDGKLPGDLESKDAKKK